MSRPTRRAGKAIARAHGALGRERRRLDGQAQAIRAALRLDLEQLRGRIAQRLALAGPSAAEQRDTQRDREALEERMREAASAAVVRLRGIERACARLAASRRELTDADARMAEAYARMVREEKLARWLRSSGQDARPQPLAHVSAIVDAAVDRAEASVERAHRAVGRQEARLGRGADELTLARGGSLPDLEAHAPSEEPVSLEADDWEALRVVAEREVASLPLDASGLNAWVDSAGPRRQPGSRPASKAMSNGVAVVIGLIGAATLVLGAAFVGGLLPRASPTVAPSVVAHETSIAHESARATKFAGHPAPVRRTLATPERAAGVVFGETPTKLVLGPKPIDVTPPPEPPHPPVHKARAHKAKKATDQSSAEALRAAIDRAPRSPEPRLQLAAKLEAQGNPMGAVRHLDYLRTLDTDEARRALARAAAAPGLARWVTPGWWSALAPRRSFRDED